MEYINKQNDARLYKLHAFARQSNHGRDHHEIVSDSLILPIGRGDFNEEFHPLMKGKAG